MHNFDILKSLTSVGLLLVSGVIARYQHLAMLEWAASSADYKLHRFIRTGCLSCFLHCFHDL